MEQFVDGVKNICEAHQRVAQGYIDDGSIDDACPPLRVLLTIMATGAWEGKDVRHPEVRRLFTRESLVASDWYRWRLDVKRAQDVRLWTRHADYVQRFLADPASPEVAQRLALQQRLANAQRELRRARSDEYRKSLNGTLGLDPSMSMLV